MSKKINISIALRTLSNKKCKIYKTLDYNVEVIDISNAENLGNKSWGYLDYLRKVGYSIVGVGDLQDNNAKFYPSKDSSSVIKPQKRVQIKPEEKKWHSYADLVHPSNYKGKDYTSSELNHLQMLNHFQEKHNISIHKKGRLDIKELKLRKKNLGISFTNTTIFSSNFESLIDIPKNKN
jgi:hypothetical protein